MRMDTAILRSKLARKILFLLLICALIPITVLAFVSLRHVENQLREESRNELRQFTHEEALSIVERLSLLEAQLKLLAALQASDAAENNLGARFNVDPARRFKGVELIMPGGESKTLLGLISSRLSLTPEQRAHLLSGKPVLLTNDCSSPRLCVFLLEQVDPGRPDRGILAAQIDAAFLWSADDLPDSKSLCVLDELGRELYCSAGHSAAFSSLLTADLSGRFKWTRDGKDYKSDFWNVFLKPHFYAHHWAIITSQVEDPPSSPLSRFKRVFLLVVLLVLWIVLLLSLVLIRRNLVPLGKLQEGTQRIAGGEFQARVCVTSGDEFQDLADSFNSMAGRIENQIDLLKTNSDIDCAILSSRDIEQVVDSLLARLPRLLPYQFVSVALLDPGSAPLALSYLRSSDPLGEEEVTAVAVPERDVAPLKDSLPTKLFDADGPLPEFLQPLVSRGMRCFLVLPIVVRGDLVAILSVADARSFVWKEDHRLEARQIADKVGVALSNARLLDDLRQLHWSALLALARAIDAKSPWTSGHSERVTNMALQIARELRLPPKELDTLRRGGLLHDIGKIGVPGHILDKPGKLTADETTQLREHVAIGARILEPIPGFADCLPIVLEHHEWYDGTGYPAGLAGENISILARIFAVADCYDALISERPYRRGLPLEQVLRIMRKEVGKQYDPRVFKAFLRAIARRNAPSESAEFLPAAIVAN